MKSYVLQNAYALWVALAAFVGGVSFWAWPHVARDASMMAAVGGIAYIWAALYLLGGAMTASGIIAASPRVELAGICLLGPALVTNGVAIIAIHGASGFVSGIVTIGLAAASFVRIIVLWVAYQIDKDTDDPRGR